MFFSQKTAEKGHLPDFIRIFIPPLRKRKNVGTFDLQHSKTCLPLAFYDQSEEKSLIIGANYIIIVDDYIVIVDDYVIIVDD
ncbi:MAG: hypothetical protein IJX44_03470 [Bacteroidaceae bacterium]|nr:hypothetical protein [Bacteroidaceae bacterium]